jgi:hypothetical protein
VTLPVLRAGSVLAATTMFAFAGPVAQAASLATTTPTSTTPSPPALPVSWCAGSLSRATPTIDDPNLTNYLFYCDGDVTAYTVLIERPGHPNDGADDFSTAAGVFNRSTGAEIDTENFSCSGIVPGDGINCFAGTGSWADQWSNIEGQFDTSDPFCANLPPHPKPGTKPEPGALALIVVTDTTGAQAGPFQLTMTPACPTVKPVPYPKHHRHRRVSRHARRYR